MARSKNEESKGLDLIENPEAIISKTEAFFNDKKNQNGKINFTLLNGIGDCSFDNLFSLDEL